jgi:hypothetical protein
LEATPLTMTVVMISAGFHPYVGGAEKQALELSVALRARGIEVKVLTRRLGGLPRRDNIRGVPVERLWCAGSGAANALTFMASLCGWLWRHAREYSPCMSILPVPRPCPRRRWAGFLESESL